MKRFIGRDGERLPIPSGTTLGHYEIIELIGAGGMGEVYKARDPRLNRTVAVKVLLEHISDKPEARARFEREAQLIASLNNPHICVVYDVGRHEKTNFLVMELLDGETLARRLERGPLPLDQALRYGAGIADALDKAHRQGVTHRDLKPGNIMLTKLGLKLLDFGLAKLRPSQSAASLSGAATKMDVTAEGTILGSLHYMAPEQLEGAETDARTDIFAFGAVLQEMLTGRKAFEGKSAVSVMSAILKDTPPPVSQLHPGAPAALDRLIGRCLAKDPDDRWQSAGDLWHELKWLADSSAQVVGEKPVKTRLVAKGWRRTIPLGISALIALTVGVGSGFVVWTLKQVVAVNTAPVARMTVALPPGEVLGNLGTPSIALSPDGATLVYVGIRGNSAPQLYVRALDSLETEPIAGTEGAASPFFSANGQWIGFFAQGKLKKVLAAGGAAQVLCDAAAGLGGTWGADDTIYFAPFNTSGVWKVSAGGGKPQEVIPLNRSKGEVSHRWPQILPGRKALLFTVWTGPGADEKRLHLQILETGERRELAQGASTGRYVSSGHLLYSRADALMAVPFDLSRLQVNGSPVALPERAFEIEAAPFAVSNDGRLAYVPADPQRSQRRLVWVDAKGNVEPLPMPPRAYFEPAISPDGHYAAVTIDGPVEGIWILEFSRLTLTSLTQTSLGSSQAPVWTPDGKRVVYRGTRTGFRNIYWKAVDGSGEEERLTRSDNLQTPGSWAPDGRQLSFSDIDLATGSDNWILSVDGERKPKVLLKTTASEAGARFSPDGRWLAYSSDESGTREIYVRPFPGPGGKHQISTDGGTEPVWSRDGRQLYYRKGDKMMAVNVATRPGFIAGSPRFLFGGQYQVSDTGRAGYDVASDGRFLMVQPVEPEQPATQINFVINLFEELKRRVPAGKP
jgi:serine/threonine-protein kinase